MLAESRRSDYDVTDTVLVSSAPHVRAAVGARCADAPNGAEFTTVHVSRGAAFLRDYLPKIALGAWAEIAAEIIHYTGYERPFKSIVAPDPRDHKLGHPV